MIWKQYFVRPLEYFGGVQKKLFDTENFEKNFKIIDFKTSPKFSVGNLNPQN